MAIVDGWGGPCRIISTIRSEALSSMDKYVDRLFTRVAIAPFFRISGEEDKEQISREQQDVHLPLQDRGAPADKGNQRDEERRIQQD